MHLKRYCSNAQLSSVEFIPVANTNQMIAIYNYIKVKNATATLSKKKKIVAFNDLWSRGNTSCVTQ